ncbi:MAG: hypothetical protein AUK44_00890 [Porphyromonadaceae bacterium CG2_30_38_12]|nr:MAG: hypothetical protein AUK44_00890 [Porphyromonadaceae bacterium CG2_30_38_12]
MGVVVLIFYIFSLLFFLFYSLLQGHILLAYKALKAKKNVTCDPDIELSNYPAVTIQLPIFNERYVASRLLDAIAHIDYPKQCIDIQVLDDSTDDTGTIVASQVTLLKQQGFHIEHITRSNREGFKAGALKAGLESAKGEFIAIFDADFIPCPLFLKKTLCWFEQATIGVVQTRWGHINRNFSLLTKLQAMALDAHFSMEQSVRDANNYFLNFNGTAGVWRKSCILDAGNWKGNTLTEDLDLSYRAQLKGWKIKYLEDVVSPAELPVNISAIRSQQFRWTKGGAQNFLLNAKKIRQSNITKTQKLQALYHLFNSTTFVIVFLMAVVSIPVMMLYGHEQSNELLRNIGLVFLLPTLILFLYYSVPYFSIEKGNKNFLTYLYHFFFFMVFMMGLSLSNTIAVIEAYLGIQSSFIRTPKFNIGSEDKKSVKNIYIRKKMSVLNLLEGLFAIVFMLAVGYELYHEIYGFLYFHLTLALGFSTFFILTLKEYFNTAK